MNLSDMLDNSVSPPSLSSFLLDLPAPPHPTFKMLLNQKPNESILGNEVQFTQETGVVSLGDCLEMGITMRDRGGSLGNIWCRRQAQTRWKGRRRKSFLRSFREGKIIIFWQLSTAPVLSLARNWYKNLDDEECEEKTTFCFRSPESPKWNQTLKPLTTRDHNERQRMIVEKVRFPVDTNCLSHTFIDCEEENVKQRRLQLIEAVNPSDLKLKQ